MGCEGSGEASKTGRDRRLGQAVGVGPREGSGSGRGRRPRVDQVGPGEGTETGSGWVSGGVASGSGRRCNRSEQGGAIEAAVSGVRGGLGEPDVNKAGSGWGARRAGGGEQG